MSEVKVNKISPRTNCGTTQLGDAGDTITVTGDLKSNSLKSASGSTITLGQSGDTIQLGCGATQTGFGRTGTVDWDTTAKTASFTAVSGNGYFVNTTSGAITVTLPAGSAGSIVSLADYAGTWSLNNVTVTPNGTDKIGGVQGNATLNVVGQSVTFVYADSIQGWKNIQDSTSNVSGADYIVATGGTITTCGDYKIHTFTGPGTFCVSSGGGPLAVVDYLVVAGGGGTGARACQTGGGGAGGFRLSNSTCMSVPQTSPLANSTGLPVGVAAYPITVGAGGACTPNATPTPTTGNPGSNSSFSTITSTGGGAGAGQCASDEKGKPGGSGGGSASGAGGVGNTPAVSPPQGNPGGSGSRSGPNYGSGGGGGAGAAGGNGTSSTAGNGGTGSYVVSAGFAGCNGTPGPVSGARYFAGGGGGGSETSAGGGGDGGGGDGSANPGAGATDGAVNTGGGAGSGNDCLPQGKSGGSGIVIIRYKYQ